MTIRPYHDFLATHSALLAAVRAFVDSTESVGRPFHIALSGGGTPLDFFRFWVAHATDFPWSRVHFWWVDERCVGPEDSRSNFSAAWEHLLKPAGVVNSYIHRIQGELLPEQAARNYGMEIENYLPRSAQGVPCFDLVMLGVGTDGHLASIFPGVPLLNAHPWAGVSHSPDGLARITLNAEVLVSARRLCFLVTGSEKRSLLEALDVSPSKVSPLPVAQVMARRPDAQWFVTYNT
jgi:6-phosphogluconolactonase